MVQGWTIGYKVKNFWLHVTDEIGSPLWFENELLTSEAIENSQRVKYFIKMGYEVEPRICWKVGEEPWARYFM